MKERNRYRYSRGLLLLCALLLVEFLGVDAARTAHAANRVRTVDSLSWQSQVEQQNRDAGAIDLTVYLGTAGLMPLLQERVNEHVPEAMEKAILAIVNRAAAADRVWMHRMAKTLIQPSATLIGLVPRRDGLKMDLLLSLYPEDPKPIRASTVLQFQAISGSTIQVSARPVDGSPKLVDGPLTTIRIPAGSVRKVRTTPNCGSSALAMDMVFPMQSGAGVQRPILSGGLRAFIEIPVSSLREIGESMGTISLGKNRSARNIQVDIEDDELVITADIVVNRMSLGTARTYVMPSASGGNLLARVRKTQLRVLEFFTFSDDSYNAQIEQALSEKLSAAMGGKFYVTGASIGQIPCSSDGGLILTGLTNLL